jgi:hypothetical protein
MLQIDFADGPMNMALSKRKRKCYDFTHETINMMGR